MIINKAKALLVGWSIAISASNATADDKNCDDSATTVDIAFCYGSEIKLAEQQMNKYLSAAKLRVADRLNFDKENRVPLVRAPDEIDLDRTQKAWLNYKNAQCGDVYSMNADGTIRYMLAGRCALTLIHQRTHDIWSGFLTYSDSTPPVLPEP